MTVSEIPPDLIRLAIVASAGLLIVSVALVTFVRENDRRILQPRRWWLP